MKELDDLCSAGSHPIIIKIDREGMMCLYCHHTRPLEDLTKYERIPNFIAVQVSHLQQKAHYYDMWRLKR